MYNKESNPQNWKTDRNPLQLEGNSETNFKVDGSGKNKTYQNKAVEFVSMSSEAFKLTASGSSHSDKLCYIKYIVLGLNSANKAAL